MPNKLSLTNNPFFITVLAAIEKTIAEGDRIARAHSIVLTDARILSLLTKVAAVALGKAAKTRPVRLPRDQILTALAEQLTLLRDPFSKRRSARTAMRLKPLSPPKIGSRR